MTPAPRARTRARARKIPRPLHGETFGVFFGLLKMAGLPLPESEFSFCEGRRWRFDFAWPAQRVALECDGGIWTRGRHTRGSGWLKDTEKLNTAATLGWRMLRATPQQLHDPELIATIRAALQYPRPSPTETP